jgi:hypothetical protein
LYVSKRLEIDWLPNVHFWALPAIGIGSKVFYRLSANAFVWLELAGQHLEAKAALDGKREAIDEFVRSMEVVWKFAERHLSAESVRAARKKTPDLPEYRFWN